MAEMSQARMNMPKNCATATFQEFDSRLMTASDAMHGEVRSMKMIKQMPWRKLY